MKLQQETKTPGHLQQYVALDFAVRKVYFKHTWGHNIMITQFYYIVSQNVKQSDAKIMGTLS